MWFQSLVNALRSRAQRQRRRCGDRHADRRRPLTRRPLFEGLEQRQLLTFAAAVDYLAGASPQAVLTADFNNDGRLDLATANPGDNSISVLLGDGLGGFGPAAHFDACVTAGADRASLAVADFNEDGNVDVVAVNYYTDAWYNNLGDASLLLGNGDGTFQAAISLGGWTLAAAGDFNADGHMDLVFSGDDWMSAGHGVLQVYLGDGTGGFTYPARHQLVAPASDFTVGDINGDGKLDVMALLGNGWPVLGRGDGTFVEPDAWYLYEFYTTSGALKVELGDYTGDGKLDAIFAGDEIAVHRGHGDGFFDWPINHSAMGTRQTDVATGDFNGDGKLDAVTSDADTGTVSELLGNGDGTLTYAGAHAVGLSPSAIAVGDFNGDGRADVATANAGSNTVSVLLNDGDWTPPPPPPPALRIRDRAVMEGNTGTASATFTVTLSAPSTQPVSVAYATGDGTATAGSDYQAATGTLTFAPGETTKTITVPINGDRLGEPNETFLVNLSSPTNANIADGQGVGTITDDEPRIGISDVSRSEGKRNRTTLFTFTVTLSTAYEEPVTMSFQTVNGTATTGDNDYVAKSGTLTFAPGETTKTLTIEVKGDNKKEATESFYLDLFGLSSNALFTKNRGIGTILNDD